jgi:4-amino-4-deoxy-L-arabinose transferase-like glycosyltransferase
MSRLSTTIGLVFILTIALVFRLYGLAWDEYKHYHPDERFISWVATTIEPPAALSTAFDPQKSSFNPFYWPAEQYTEGIGYPLDEPRQFAYGHVPLYMGVAFTKWVEWLAPAVAPHLPAGWNWLHDLFNTPGRIEFHHLTAAARFLTALVDVGSVLVLFWLGQTLYGREVGLLAAAFLAFNVLHIQLAHYFTTDPYLAFFVLLALVCMVQAVYRHSWQWYLLAAGVCGLAIGSKFSAILILLPLLLTAYHLSPRFLMRWSAAGLALAYLTFALTNPFAILDNSCSALTPAVDLGRVQIPAINWRSCYLENVGRQSVMVSGSDIFPFTRQYEGSWPYLYHIEMQLRWGMGWSLGVVAFVGWFWLVGRQLCQLWLNFRHKKWVFTPPQQAEYILLAWSLPFFLSTGNFFVKFMRYLQPMTPLLMLSGAWLVWQLPGRWRKPAAGLVLTLTFLHALSFSHMYNSRHPWLLASEWLYANAPAGSTILNERWDEVLPSSLDINGEHYPAGLYQFGELRWLSLPDSAGKLEQSVEFLAQADYVVIASNRVYGVTPRLPEKYPYSHPYHALLFNGQLGYELVFISGRAPNLAGYSFYPDSFTPAGLTPPPAVQLFWAEQNQVNFGRADESFTVYDQPLTLIFANKERLTPAELHGRLSPNP